MGHVHSLVTFDLDGTLIDSRRDLADSANALIEEYGGTPLSEEESTFVKDMLETAFQVHATVA